MRETLIALITMLALSAGAPSALAAGSDVIDDCSDDEVLSKTYTQKDYRDALRQIPGDFDQYGNCRDIIARAQDAAATKGGSKGGRRTGDGGGGGAGDGDASSPGATSGANPPAGPSVKPAAEQLAAASAEDRAAARKAAREQAPVAIGPGGPIGSESSGTTAGANLFDLPVPILVLLALLLAGTLALGAVRIRSLVDARRA